MKITTTETYRSFAEFSKGKRRFERIGFKCTDTVVAKTWSGSNIVATYRKDNGTEQDIALI